MSSRAARAGGSDRRHTQNGKPEQSEGGLSLTGLHRARILLALNEIVATDGPERISVTQIVRKARVSRGAFYGHFTCVEDALSTLVENALERSRAEVLRASEEQDGWESITRAGLSALLELYQDEPEIGRLCLVHARQPKLGTARKRTDMLEQLARHIAEGSRQGRRPASTLSAEGILAGALGILEERLTKEREPQLTRLEGELMSFIVLPYRGGAVARAELTRTELARARRPRRPRPVRAQTEVFPRARLRLTHRTIRVLASIASTPGLSNAGVAAQAGIADQGQISKLLKRLQALGLVQNTGQGQEQGAANAWRLTEAGRQIERSILEHHAPARM